MLILKTMCIKWFLCVYVHGYFLKRMPINFAVPLWELFFLGRGSHKSHFAVKKENFCNLLLPRLYQHKCNSMNQFLIKCLNDPYHLHPAKQIDAIIKMSIKMYLITGWSMTWIIFFSFHIEPNMMSLKVIWQKINRQQNHYISLKHCRFECTSCFSLQLFLVVFLMEIRKCMPECFPVLRTVSFGHEEQLSYVVPPLKALVAWISINVGHLISNINVT